MNVVTPATVTAEMPDFTVVWRLPGGEMKAPLGEVTQVPFERAEVVRRPASYRGQRHFPGWYYSATTGSHVPYESWLERDHAILLDFDPMVVGFAAQPFWLIWCDIGTGRGGRTLRTSLLVPLMARQLWWIAGRWSGLMRRRRRRSRRCGRPATSLAGVTGWRVL